MVKPIAARDAEFDMSIRLCIGCVSYKWREKGEEKKVTRCWSEAKMERQKGYREGYAQPREDFFETAHSISFRKPQCDHPSIAGRPLEKIPSFEAWLLVVSVLVPLNLVVHLT